MLEQNGYIYTIAGKGSYVANHTTQSIDHKKRVLLETSIIEEIELAKSLGYSKEDLKEMIEKIYSK